MFVLQLIIGDFSLSFEQSKSQFAIWSIMASVWLNLAIIDDNFVFFHLLFSSFLAFNNVERSAQSRPKI